MSKRRYQRQLIQFSSYSIAVVLPKKICTEFGWEAGETVDLRVAPGRQELTLTISQTHGPIDRQNHVVRSSEEPVASSEDPDHMEPEDLTPIPEIH